MQRIWFATLIVRHLDGGPEARRVRVRVALTFVDVMGAGDALGSEQADV